MRESKTLLDSEFYAVVEFWIPVKLVSIFQRPRFQITQAKFPRFQIHKQKFPRGGKDVWFDCGVVWCQGGTPDFKWQGWSNGGLNYNPNKTWKKSLDQNLTRKKSHAKFPSHKKFQKALNNISIGNSMICSDIWHKHHKWYFKIFIHNFTSR